MKIAPSLLNFKGNTQRFDEIARTLARYGLAGWIGTDRLEQNTPSFIKGLFTDADGALLTEYSREARIRMALTDLGTTFIQK